MTWTMIWWFSSTCLAIMAALLIFIAVSIVNMRKQYKKGYAALARQRQIDDWRYKNTARISARSIHNPQPAYSLGHPAYDLSNHPRERES